MPDPGLERALERARSKYLDALDAQITTVESLVATARQEAGRVEAIRSLLVYTHRLHGSAGTYGFPELSRAAAIADALLQPINECSGHLDAPTEEALAEMARVARLASRELHDEELAAISVDEPPRLLLVRADAEAAQPLMADPRVLMDLATTWSEALDAVRNTWYEGVLIDADLGGDGMGFVIGRSLRRLPHRGSLQLGFLATDDSLDARVAATRAGATLFLPEPVGAPDILDAAARFSSYTRSEPGRVLIVDDDPDFCAHIQLTLEAHGMRVSAVSDPSQTLQALAREQPELLLLDVFLPGVSGLELCRTIRANPAWSDLLILFISAEPDLKTRQACFEAGGDDYIHKPVVEAEILARIRDRLERQRLARERWESDPLSGLLSRRGFVQAFNRVHSEALRTGTPLSVALIDLDHFKKVNDQHGHLVGDRVLGALGPILTRVTRPSDRCARWGGEEFLVAFSGLDPKAAAIPIERALNELAGHVFHGEAGEPFNVTFSAGIAGCPSDGTTLDSVLKVADRRLYQAKNAGRSRVVSSD